MEDDSSDGRAPADDRRPVAAGFVLWLVATVIVATVSAVREVPAGALWTCSAGLAAGIAGLIYVTRRSRRP